MNQFRHKPQRAFPPSVWQSRNTVRFGANLLNILIVAMKYMRSHSRWERSCCHPSRWCTHYNDFGRGRYGSMVSPGRTG
jgi:hypothetical protein